MHDSKPKLYIDGQWREGAGEKSFDVISPTNGERLLQFPLASTSDLDDAVSSAAGAFAAWRDRSPWDRGRILKDVARIVEGRKEHLARVLTLEQGKPIGEAAGEIERMIETFSWCGEEATRSYGRVYPQRAPGMRQLTLKQPIGPVAAFSPWNFPAVLSARKIAPALAAGCTIVIKPAEETPGVCVAIFEALADAGVPPGVANLVFGSPEEVSNYLLSRSEIRKVSLTGSTEVGRKLSHLAAEGLTNVTMELGGHAPVLVFSDTNVEKAAEMTAIFKYRNAGQVCLAPSRLYVQKSVFKKFVAKYLEVSRAIKVGDGMDPSTQMGPLANSRRLQAMLDMVSDAKEHGGKILCGGDRISDRGYYMSPTVVTELDPESRLLSVEPFGPLSPVVPFSSFDEAIDLANNSPYGLAAYAFTESSAIATAFADRIEAGWIGINGFSPFLADAAGGGVKQSGCGYEGGIEGMDAYLLTKFVSQSSLVQANL